MAARSFERPDRRQAGAAKAPAGHGRACLRRRGRRVVRRAHRQARLPRRRRHPPRPRRLPLRRRGAPRQFRASGEPYITHPIAVAGLCAEWKLDVQAIMAALMHDAMEDCGVTQTGADRALRRAGGRPRRRPHQARPPALLDPRGIAGRVVPQDAAGDDARRPRDPRQARRSSPQHAHDGRGGRREAHAIATETIDIYAPIAHRLGLNQTYRELQELSFKHMHPWREAALSKSVLKARGYGATWSTGSTRTSRSRSRRPACRRRSSAARRRSTRSTPRCARST